MAEFQEVMTIDEIIEQEKRLAEECKSHIGEYDKEFSNRCKKDAEKHEQLAEWLEELKELRELIKAYENAPSDAYWYNKAIDDIVSIIKEMRDTAQFMMNKYACDRFIEQAEQLRK